MGDGGLAPSPMISLTVNKTGRRVEWFKTTLFPLKKRALNR